MLVKTRGIVLKCTRYSESSVVMQVFTEELGLQSYLINGIRKNKSKISPAIMQPLHLLDMVVYNKEGGSIQRVSEIRNSPPYLEIPFNTLKSSLVLFLNEVIYKSVRQGHQDSSLFGFIFKSLQALDNQSDGLADYHIYFLIRLTEFLGICPSRPVHELENKLIYFDLKNGVFEPARPLHPSYSEPELSAEFARALICVGDDTAFYSFSRPIRKALVELMLEYFAWHIEGFGIVRSWEILEDVFK